MTCFELLVTQMLASETSGNSLLKFVDYFKLCLPFCLRWTMLCYVMLCYVMLCYVMLPVCYVTCMLCYYVILWRTHKTLAITLTAYTVCRIVRLLKQSSQFSRPVTLHDFIKIKCLEQKMCPQTSTVQHGSMLSVNCTCWRNSAENVLAPDRHLKR